jgi:hypothetical protein
LKPEAFAAFTQAIVDRLDADPRVIGLVAAGSAAGTDRQPDAWSDHDLWIVTVPGQQEHFRTAHDWLPEPERIVVAYRETEHAAKRLYDDGHLIECAVVDESELDVMLLNSYRVLIDKANLAHRLAERHARTTQAVAARPHDDAKLWGEFLSHLIVGVGRHQRGEKLSGLRFVKVFAILDLLGLIDRHVPPERPAPRDNLDPLRRFEAAYPTLGARINAALALDTPLASAALIDLADDLFRDRLAVYSSTAIATARAYASRLPGKSAHYSDHPNS